MWEELITRPYIGETPEEFKRTSNRHDFAVVPSIKTTLNYLQEKGINVIGVWKNSWYIFRSWNW